MIHTRFWRQSRMVVVVVAAILGIGSVVVAQQKPSAGMMRFPDISADSIVFSYAGDLWIVSRDGGMARPLASPQGSELFPRFSSDGKSIAFVGNYDGDSDIYVISSTGGIAQRRTFHPSTEILCDWTPDGSLLYSTNGFAGLQRQPQLFVMPKDGQLAEQLPVPYGTNGTISADGKWLAYTPHSRDNRTWKRYRGGMASNIWLFNLESKESVQVTDWEGTDSLPMWHGEKLYYLSDGGSEQRLNIWVYDTQSKERTQVTKFADDDCKWPSIGPGPGGDGEIVLQNGTQLWVVDLKSGERRAVEITVPGDRMNLRPKMMDTSEMISSGDISPKAKRVVVEARGDLWTLPAKKGTPRNLTRSSGVAERMPAWSPDGRWIAYFSDASGEYELYVTQSDGRGETKQLTDDGKRYRYDPMWSPDSKHIVFTDNSGSIYLTTIETGETRLVDDNRVQEQRDVSWSHDSRWLTYAKSVGNNTPVSTVWVYNVADQSKQQITNTFFPCQNPTFDRDGDYIFCSSNRVFNSPEYADADTTFIYRKTEVLLAIPLRADVKQPLLPESDEEEWKEEEESDDKEGDDEESEDESDEDSDDDDSDDDDSDDDDSNEDEEDEDEEGDDDEASKSDDPLSGTWAGSIESDQLPDEAKSFSMVITYEDGKISGEIINAQGNLDISSGSFDEATKTLKLIAENDDVTVRIEGTIDGNSFSGKAIVEGMGELPLSATRDSGGAGDDDKDGKGKKSDKAKEVKIEFEDIQNRIFQLPVSPGNFSGLSTNEKGHLVYARVTRQGRGGGSAGLKIFDIKDDKKAEKKIVDGVRGYSMTPDGKNLMVRSGNSTYIIKAAAGQSLSDKVPTSGMKVSINPREEWKQIFVDAWRIEREFFYDPTMHGVDWDAVRKHYEPMIDDCTSRADVAFVIGEMISEINVGHAYYRGGGSGSDNGPSEAVGLLGCTFEADGDRYKVGKIFEGSPWDTDAKNGLRAVGIKEGDFILSVNGINLTTDQNPYSAFQGLSGATVSLMISDDATADDDDKQILVKTMNSDNDLRFRNWIENNRQMVSEKTDGRVGYIYVINTGVPGQNDLFRQFFGQLDKEALIIDDRWNGGGQIPTRFIELLNRPVTNYWAKRHGADWTWPPDSHQGPKCMLINGMAGSGGDMFPALFKQNKLGKLIGMRTWGGLVGISGGPQMVDGSAVTAPSFAYYEKDGTWGIEGHGVDPDMEVIDDPAKMQNGGDPQLEAAIAHMLKELETNGYQKPDRPKYPDRRKIGLEESDK